MAEILNAAYVPGSYLTVSEGAMFRWRILVEDLTVITCNIKDFTGPGVSLLNPWEPQS